MGRRRLGGELPVHPIVIPFDVVMEWGNPNATPLDEARIDSSFPFPAGGITESFVWDIPIFRERRPEEGRREGGTAVSPVVGKTSDHITPTPWE